ncbi:MAG: hypothetical protein ACUZ9M_00525 [Candidatus Scalindua sp.]
MYKDGFQYDFDRPFVRFLGGGKKAKLPPIEDPATRTPIVTPEEIDTRALQAGETERRKIKSRRGRPSTILTEATLGTAGAAKSAILGVVGK